MNAFAKPLALHSSRRRVPDTQWYLDHGLSSVVHLAYLRADALEREMDSVSDPEFSVDFPVPLDEVGYDCSLPKIPLRKRPIGVQEGLKASRQDVTAKRQHQKALDPGSSTTLDSGPATSNPLLGPSLTSPADSRTSEPGSADIGILRPLDFSGKVPATAWKRCHVAEKTSDQERELHKQRTRSSSSSLPGGSRRDWTPPTPSKLRQIVQTGDDRTKLWVEFRSPVDHGVQPDQPLLSDTQIAGTTNTEEPTKHPSSDSGQVIRDAWFQSLVSAPVPHRRHSGPPSRQSTGEDKRPLVRPTPRTLRVTKRSPFTDRISPRRLLSSELIPDRFKYGQVNPSPTQPANAKVSRSTAQGKLVQEVAELHIGTLMNGSSATAENDFFHGAPASMFGPNNHASRRAAAHSDSDRSSVSSTESSRARRALAFTLDNDKASSLPKAAKATSSIGFSGVGSLFKNMVNSILPASPRSSAGGSKRKLSRNVSPASLEKNNASTNKGNDHIPEEDESSETLVFGWTVKKDEEKHENFGEFGSPLKPACKRSHRNTVIPTNSKWEEGFESLPEAREELRSPQDEQELLFREGTNGGGMQGEVTRPLSHARGSVAPFDRES